MADQKTCRVCGEELTEAAAEGLCPQCALRAARELLVQPDQGDVTLPTGIQEDRGATIDRYKLLERLGEGGFGVVWVAEQRQPVRRRVALKIIKLGMDTKQVVARFEAERQALALMDHPNIAKVLDAGATKTGRPYFVMELVKGVPITEYCDQEKLGTRERLDLFIKICHAIQHAHQKGIIHRDIKPSNIMITLHDGMPVPKVIDFGIAKATQQELTEKTIYTQYSQFIGTPAYMSPEQAEMSGLDIDTRSDVYALGVLLYELLTGTTPFATEELVKSGLDEMRKIIREREPVKPSTRLTLLKAVPKTEIRKPKSEIASDLDWIVMKCLEKDRTRRYETANGLARDLERHLKNEPVVARPPTAVYQFQKFARRHRTALMTASAFAMLLVAATLVSGVLAIREGHARRLADQARQGERHLNFTMAFDRGMTLCEQGQIGSGLLWLVQALELTPSNEDAMERVIRANLNAWRRELHALDGIFPHEEGGVTAAFSPDGKTLLTGSTDGVVQRWHRRTGAPIGNPLQHEKEVHEVLFTPDGARFLTASYDQTAHLWETESGRLLRTFQHDSQVFGLVLTPEGRIVTSTGKGRMRIWDWEERDPVDELPPRPGFMMHDLALSPDGKRLLADCHDGVVTLWELATHKLIARFPHTTTRVLTADFVGPDGTRIATADSDGNVVLWEWPDGETTVDGYPVGETYRHRGGVHRLRGSPDGKRILTASFDNHAQFLDAETGRPIGVPIEHQGAVMGVAFSKDGSVLTACGDDATRLWRPAPGSLLREVPFEDGTITNEALFTDDGRYCLMQAPTGIASVYDTQTGALLGTPFRPSGGIYAFAVTPDKRKIMTGGADKRVQIWEAQTGLPLGRAFDHGGSVWAVAASRDGLRMLSVGTNGIVKLWDAPSGTPGHTVLSLPVPIQAVAFHPLDSSLAVIGGGDKRARLINVLTRNVLHTLEGHQGMVMVVAFSPDGRRILTGGFDNTVRIWDTKTGLSVSKPMRHQGPFWYYSNFSPEGSMVVTGCDDGTTRIWDVETAKPIGPKLQHEAALRTAAFVAGGTEIVTGTAKGKTRFWKVTTAPMAGTVERIKVWLQVVTGMQLDSESGEIEVLDAHTWQERRESLRQLGGAPN